MECVFLVATGRASASQDLTAEEYEEVFAFLYDLSKTAPFDIKTTEAQHYRRYVAQRRKAEGAGKSETRHVSPEIIQRQAGINDGKGFVFVSHTGEIFPSGFLPLAAGNVRRDSLATIYRESPRSALCATPTIWEGSAATANIAICAVVLDRAPTR